MAKMGFSSWVLIVVLASQGVWSRPPVREVKLITHPSPGQEFVSIQSSVFSQKAVKTTPEETEGDFATSHKIPGQLPVDEPADEDEDEVDLSKDLEQPGKIKREDAEALATLQGAILTPDLLPIAEERSSPKAEFRMEFSVVTSKPRKEVKEYKEKSPALGSKIAVNQKKVAFKSVDKEDDVPEFEVEVDSKGNFGKLDAGLTGSDEKKVMAKKQSIAVAAAAAALGGEESVKGQEQILKEVEINPASEVGVKSPEVVAEVGAITVPLQKQPSAARYAGSTATVSPASRASEKAYDILPVNLVKNTDKTKEADFDFVDSPLADKLLVPAGSNQQSRIEVKKGPNGQDYEYEYVYYYYDDDENESTGSEKKPAASKSSTAAPATTTTAAPTSATSRQHLSEVVHTESVDHARGRGRTRAPPTATAAPAAPAAAPEVEVGARTKYASVERPTATAAPDTANEIIPARGTAARSRGRTVTTEEPSTVSAEERLPANTRFPPRSRSNHNSNSISATSPAPAPAAAAATPQDAPAPRVRGGSVRRPSLELVDSSSFKTQSSDASRDQDLRPEFPARLPTANEEEEVEEVVKPSRGSRFRGQTSTAAPEVEEEDEDISSAPRRGQPNRGPVEEEDDDVVEDTSSSNSGTEPAQTVPASDVVGTTSRVEDVGLTQAFMDKAVNDLYSLAQAENSIDEEPTELSAEEEVTTELEEVTTTPEPTTVPTTTTTTTTVAPTTTTTEATTTAATGRGRYRPRGGNAGAPGTRNRFRGNKDEATSTTTEAPVETSTKARRFGGNRVTSGSYGRRGFSKATTSQPEGNSDSDKEEEAVKEVAKVESAAPAVRTGGFSRNRFSAGRTSRVTTSTTASPTASEDSAPSSPSSPSPAKPAFADRFNSLRRRGGLKQSTTVAPLNEETKSDSSGEETNEPSTLSDAPTTTAKPTGRTRLSIGSGPRPGRPSPRVNIGGRGRLGATTTTTTTAAPSTELDEGSNEQTSSSSQDEAQSQSDEAQEAVTTPVPDALTRLRNRPRLRVNAAKHVASTAAPVVRRPLGLLPRRRPQPAEVKEASESESQDSSNASSNSEESEASVSSEETSEASTDASSSATTVQEQPQENNRLSSLLSGRRRGNALRRQRNLFPSGPKQANQEGSS